TAKPVLEDWMRQRHHPATHLRNFIEAWPEISEDLRLLPGMLHRAIHRAEVEEAATLRRSRLPAPRPLGRAGAARLDRLMAGAALLIAGAIWAGSAEPVWVGWAACAPGLVLLFVRPA